MDRGRPIPVPTKSCIIIYFKELGMVWIQNKTILTGSAELSSRDLDDGDVHATGVLTESVDLVSHIEDVASRALFKEGEIHGNIEVMEPMVEGRCFQILLDNNTRFGWR